MPWRQSERWHTRLDETPRIEWLENNSRGIHLNSTYILTISTCWPFVLSFLQLFVIHRHGEPTISVENGLINFITACRTSTPQPHMHLHRMKNDNIRTKKKVGKKNNRCLKKLQQQQITVNKNRTLTRIRPNLAININNLGEKYFLNAYLTTNLSIKIRTSHIDSNMRHFVNKELCYRYVSGDEQASDNITGTCGTDTLSHILLLTTSLVDQQQRWQQRQWLSSQW